MRSKISLALEDATAILHGAAAVAHPRQVSIAIVDEAGELLSFMRMDGARSHTIELAIKKAKVSAQVGVPSAVIHAAGRADITAGGLPIMADGQCAGAIGVSGATVEDDVRIATAGIDHWGREIDKSSA